MGGSGGGGGGGAVTIHHPHTHTHILGVFPPLDEVQEIPPTCVTALGVKVLQNIRPRTFLCVGSRLLSRYPRNATFP